MREYQTVRGQITLFGAAPFQEKAEVSSKICSAYAEKVTRKRFEIPTYLHSSALLKNEKLLIFVPKMRTLKNPEVEQVRHTRAYSGPRGAGSRTGLTRLTVINKN